MSQSDSLYNPLDATAHDMGAPIDGDRGWRVWRYGARYRWLAWSPLGVRIGRAWTMDTANLKAHASLRVMERWRTMREERL